MSEFALLTPVKARPVLIITGTLPEHEAWRSGCVGSRLGSDAARQRVRDGSDRALFHLRPERFPRLPVENAVIVTSLLRLPLAALDRRESLGALDENELRVVHERVARAHELKLELLIFERAQELATRARVKP